LKGRWRRAGAALLALGGAACANDEREAFHTRAATPAATCSRCHAEIVNEWAGSEHRASDDAVFRAAVRGEAAQAFCKGCHAAETGIGCASCHGEVQVGFWGHGAVTTADSPPRGACAKCHEFEFPGPREHAEKMQSTASEHAASPYTALSCSECHMPRVRDGWFGAHRSHAFAEAREPARLRAALAVRAERTGASRVALTLASKHVGHAYPTGDLFRRLVVEVDALGPDFSIVASARRDLARHFVDVPSSLGPNGERVAARDDRVMPGAASRIELDLGAEARGRPVAWRVRYERVLQLNPRHEADARVESSLVLASGELPEAP
jgi:hypothetical protein